MKAQNYGLAMVAFLALSGTGQAAPPVLTVADVNQVLAQAAQAAQRVDPSAVIAVTDREGFVLGVYGVSGSPPDPYVAGANLTTSNAIAKAGTAAYLSSGGEAFTSRTAGFIIQPHFPPGIINTGTGPLVGVGFSSLQFSDINHFRNPNNPDPAKSQAIGIPGTTLSGNPGGMPLYKGGVLVGGVGVDSNAGLSALTYVPGPSTDEDVAVIAQSGYGPPSSIVATQDLINGIRLPYADYSGGSIGTAVLNPANFSTEFPNPTAANQVNSTGQPFQAGLVPYNTNPLTQTPLPQPSPFGDIPGGEVRDTIIDSPYLHTSLINGQPRLSAAEVTTILHNAALRAQETRGAIRNPIGSAEVFIVVVDFYPPPLTPTSPPTPSPLPPPSPAPYAYPRPQILGSFRTPDATIFSYDVAAQKGRTALFFSNNQMAMSCRAVGFLAEGNFPPGIDGTAPGPYHTLQPALSASAVGNSNASVNPYLPNGITIFPGGFPLYRNGVLIGAIGVSGDGVDQDDIISASGTVGFEAPDSIRADEFSYRGARLPYAKFPQNAGL